MTSAEYASVDRVVTSTARRPPEDGTVTVAEIERPDHSRILVEGRRTGGGAIRYFLRDDTLRAAAEAAGSDTGELNLDGAPITMVTYGDVDGDGSNDMILRTADTPNDDDTQDQLYVITTSGEVGEITAVPEPTGPNDPAYDPEPATGGATAPSTRNEGTGQTAASSPPPSGVEGFEIETRLNMSPSSREGI
jgi:hypothetical protein